VANFVSISEYIVACYIYTSMGIDHSMARELDFIVGKIRSWRRMPYGGEHDSGTGNAGI
jgi:hypothetical protein